MKALVITVRDPGAGGDYTRVFESSPVRVGRDPSVCQLVIERRDVAPLHLEFQFDDSTLSCRDFSAGLESADAAADLTQPRKEQPLYGRTELTLGGWVTLSVRRGTGETPATAYTPSPVGPAPSPRSEPHAGPVPSVRSPHPALDLDATFVDPPAQPIVSIEDSETEDPEATIPPAATPGLPKRLGPRTEVLPQVAQPQPRHRGPLPQVVPGSILGQYRVERFLGQGGMGTVFEASHTGVIEKRFAIKVLSPELAAHPHAEKRFLAEAGVASRLDHPNIVNVMDFGSEDGVSYLAMEYLKGESLGDRIHRKELSIARTADIMIAVAAGVTAAHDKGICHRDLKPENIFLTAVSNRETVPKILDFGIAKLLEADLLEQTNSRTGSIIGTPNYLAPEQAEKRLPANAKSDQYALGAILYECVTRRRAHEGPTLYSILRSIAEADYPQPSSLRPDIPPEFEAVINKAMHKNPSQRFASVRELGRALLPFISRKRLDYWAHHYSDEQLDESAYGGVPLTRTEQRVTSSASPKAGGTRLLPDFSPQKKKKTRQLGAQSSHSRHRWLWPGLAVLAALLISAAWRLVGQFRIGG